ncbi:MAG: hypothetical protein WBA74_11765, partial [Cyclobacteriaceae bacterium]
MKHPLILLLIILFFGSCASTKKIPADQDPLAQKVTIKEIDIAYKNEFPQKKRKKKMLIFTQPSDEFFREADLAFHSSDERLKVTIYDDLKEIYTKRGFDPIWLTARKPKTTYTALLNQFENSIYHGIDPEIYQFSSIKDRVTELNNGELSLSEIAQLDYDITANFLLYSAHISYGRIKPEKLTGYWHTDKRRVDLAKKLTKVKTGKNFNKYVDNILPELDTYKDLVSSLKKYSELKENGGWEKIPDTGVDVLEPGESNESIPYIRRRLAVTDMNVAADPTDSMLYNDRLVSAVKK